ncbi:class I SAM-dependent methyltransferase [Prochlorococcus sp. MIT 1300]|uniref:class I SAM-dependent methyltransferase n=1 Tax=Prochlorococcus sp. MIT 1300 TaxID=3096218 RepID=UPI002A765B52|nr:class I SAM-dependent methyltransferase [Prochlorococcus sp. MIT 1300]
MKISVDLGCGSTIRNPYEADKVIGIDIHAYPGVMACNLFCEPIPLPDQSVDFVTAIDFIEHLPRTPIYEPNHVENPFIFCMNQISRVLKTGGTFMHKTPAYPKPEAFMDPTHTNIITEKTIIYFAKIPTEAYEDSYSFIREISSGYGIQTRFVLKSSKWENYHLIQTLEKY